MTRLINGRGKTVRFARAVAALALGALTVACAKDEPPPRLAAANTLLAAAEGQSDLFLSRGSSYGDYLAGLVAGRERDLTAAADYMIRALENDPDNPELLLRAFVLSAADGRQAETLRLARRLTDIEPSNVTANLVLAVDAVVRDDLELASQWLDAMPDRGLPAIYRPLLKGWLQVARGDLEAAVAAAADLAEREGFAGLHALHVALFYDVGGDRDSAMAAFESMLADVREPSLRLAWLAGNFLERAGAREAAVEAYRSYREANPESSLLDAAAARVESGVVPAPVVSGYQQGWAEVLFNLAGVLSQERAEDMALIHAYLALRLKPDLEIGHLLIGEILESQDRGEAAIAAYRRIDTASPLAWSARLRIAEVLGRLERTEAAVAELESLAVERPGSFEPLYRVGNLLRLEERFGEAVVAYDRAYERLDTIEPHHWSLLYFRGISLERDDQWARAEGDFLKALELRPEQPYVMNYLAYSWVEKQTHLDEAKAMLVRAVDLRPNDGYIVDSLGWVYFRLGEVESAVSYLERAVELRSQDPVINDHLGDAYWRVGRRREARFQWRRALSLDPEEDLVSTIEAKIERGLAARPENI